MPRWTVADLPDLTARTYVITGANGGLGLHTAAGLAKRGARVILACRDLDRAAAAADTIRAEHAAAELVPLRLDLADLRSIERFAGELRGSCDAVHGLVNNAGVMAAPFGETIDGFEMQLGINHLGHFALTGRLMPLLLSVPGARVVTVTSLVHRIGKIRFDDLMGKRRYERWTAYGQSKLANLLFTFELHRRALAARVDLLSVAAHPGYASTGLQTTAAAQLGSRLGAGILRLGSATIAQSARHGALPTLFAVADPSVQSGEVFGPGGPFQLRGGPTRVHAFANALDKEVAAELWRVSEQLTGVRYPELSRAG